MKKKEPLKPQLSEPNTTDFYLEDEMIFEQLAAKDVDYSYLTCENFVIRDASLTQVTMQKTSLPRFEASNVRFLKCDFSNIDLMGASLHQVHFDQCKLTGANFAESYLRDCTFTDCVADFASFSTTNLNFVTFDKCRLQETEFYNLNWKQLTLTNCELTGSTWFGTTLAKLDFTTNTFLKLAVSQERLSGAIVTPEQALIFAAGLGLIIQ